MENPLFLKRIKRFSQLESTNLTAEDWILKEKPPEGSAVVADFQTRGSGMAGNAWESEPGKNLLVSFVLYPDFLEATEQFLINKVVSLAVKECVRNFIDTVPVQIKWPNDIYAGNRKIAGILSRNSIVKSRINHTIAGIGLNVNQKIFSEALPNPVSMKIISGKDYNRDEVLEVLGQKLKSVYSLLKDGRHAIIDQLYLEDMYRFNLISNYSSKGQPFTGKILGVTEFGYLKIEVDGQIKEFDIKDVEFLPN
jgi:BirA family biotin operon repressor/biotin-[acetyl-CoA-carboxylase] ligase